MGAVYAVINQKGGVGKTTTAVNVSAAAAEMGRRVLLIDLDPQGNATGGLGLKSVRNTRGPGACPTIYQALVDDVALDACIVPTSIPSLFMVTANLDLAGAEVELMPRLARETALRRALDPVRDQFDLILIDTPPSLGLLTLNALAAADAAVVPIQCEYYALEGVSQLMETIQLVCKHLNPSFEVALVVMTMFDKRVRLNRQVVDEVRRVFKERLSSAVVPRNVRLAEAPSHGKPITSYDPKSKGAIAYRRIAMEVLQDGQARTR